MTNPASACFSSIPSPENILSLSYADSLTNKPLEKTFISYATDQYKDKVEPSMRCVKRCGNMYTAAICGGLASLISSKSPEELKGKRIGVFAYGGGCAASFYSIVVEGDITNIQKQLNLIERLNSMKVVPCEELAAAMEVSSPGVDRAY